MVIVGAAMTGGNAAVALREEGYAGRVMLLGDESAIPFGRPPLSKTYLMGREDLKNWYVKPRDWYEANDVELMTGLRVEAIDIRAREVTLSGGGTLNYDGLLLATGGRNRRVPLRLFPRSVDEKSRQPHFRFSGNHFHSSPSIVSARVL